MHTEPTAVLRTPSPGPDEVWAEADRLRSAGLRGPGYGDEEIQRLAELTWRINTLKKLRSAVIAAHVYQRLEILHGIADFTGDSFRLSRLCRESPARWIVFCGVRFMAETAKILNPDKEVLLPAEEAGCSLAESITAQQVRALKAAYPGAPVVTYINTNADVKAESDVIVTSANAATILRRVFEGHSQVLFLPDAMMGRNLARDLGKKLGEELIVWDGRCIVHDNFDAGTIEYYRRLYPGVRILAHTECDPALVSLVDFAGGTGDMMRYVEKTQAPSFMLVTECGLGDLARSRFPDKTFVPMCRLCPYMKATDLSRVLAVLEDPQPQHRIAVPEGVRLRAQRALDRMFELSSP